MNGQATALFLCAQITWPLFQEIQLNKISRVELNTCVKRVKNQTIYIAVFFYTILLFTILHVTCYIVCPNNGKTLKVEKCFILFAY